MNSPPSNGFPSPSDDKNRLEEGEIFSPKFNSDGLITAIATDRDTGEVLMLAHMNDEALAKTLETKQAWFWSRSRKKLWLKGESSGNVLEVCEIRTDCDQDAIWLQVIISGDRVACHTGRKSCFYREIVAEGGKFALKNDGQRAG